MGGYFSNLLGTTKSLFQLGKGGPQVKNNSGAIEARNAADSAYAALRASLVSVFGNDIELNAGAAGSGADWKMTLRRSATGQTEALTVVLPGPSPSTGQVMTVASIAAGVVTMQWSTVTTGTDSVKADTTSIAFGTASPLTMFTLPANAVVLDVEVVIDTAFNGTPSLSIGITGTTSKYMAATEIDLTSVAGTIWHVKPALVADGSTNAIIGTYSAGGASAGAGRIIVRYVIPS